MILRLPAGLRWGEDVARAYANARGLSPPAAARAPTIITPGADPGAATAASDVIGATAGATT